MIEHDSLIHELINITTAPESLQKKLNEIVESIKARVNADGCALLLMDKDHQSLSIWSSKGLSSKNYHGTRIPRGHGVFWKIFDEKRVFAIHDLRNEPDYFPHPELGGGEFASMLCAPITHSGETLGAFCVQNREVKIFTIEEISTLENIAYDLADSLKIMRYMHTLQEEASVSLGLKELGQIIGSRAGLEDIFDDTISHALKLTGAERGVMWLTGQNGRELAQSAPHDLKTREVMESGANGLLTTAAGTRQTIKVDDVNTDRRYKGLDAVAKRSLMVQPIVFDGDLIGFILLADKKTSIDGFYSIFSDYEANILASIARMVAQAVVRVRATRNLQNALEENRKNVEELSILFQLSMAMQRAMNLDELLRVILSCVTVGKGLGFNRAILFLVNENTGSLQGMMGLGPDSAEDAGRIWQKLEKHEGKMADLVQWLIERDPYEIYHSAFNKLAQSIRASLTGDSVLAKALREKKAVNITSRDDIGPGDADLVSMLSCSSFAVAPLVARDTALGAILVDNLYNGRPITESDLRLLMRFTAPAAWGIENVKLVERLAAVNKELIDLETQMARVEKLSALGEISAEMAHELKNPLVTIGGFARRLLAKISGSRTEARYASIIVKEVERLEVLLRNTLDTARLKPIERRSVDLNQIVNDVVDFYRRSMMEKNIQLNIALSNDIDEVSMDPAQIKQVLINLLVNAMDSMSCPRHNMPRILTMVTETAPLDRSSVRLIISDTGGGVAERDLPEIFNPFFTTKQSGTGLGLSLSKKIVRMHHGTMEIDNRLGIGVTFTITLPCYEIKDSSVEQI